LRRFTLDAFEDGHVASAPNLKPRATLDAFEQADVLDRQGAHVTFVRDAAGTADNGGFRLHRQNLARKSKQSLAAARKSVSIATLARAIAPYGRKTDSFGRRNRFGLFRLMFPETRIEPALGNQRCVRPAFHNPARVQNDDLIRVRDRAQPVRHHKRRAPA